MHNFLMKQCIDLHSERGINVDLHLRNVGTVVATLSFRNFPEHNAEHFHCLTVAFYGEYNGRATALGSTIIIDLRAIKS